MPRLPNGWSRVISQHQVGGTIVDDKGEPIIGATVIEKGTKNGVTTDLDGHFSISTSSSSAVLVISYIGKDKNGDLHDRYPKYSEYGDANLTLAFFEYYAKYNADKYQTAEMPFTNWTTRNGEQTQIASSGRGHFYAGYEMVYNHYKNVLHVDAPYCKQFAEKYRPATSEHPYEFDDDFPGIGTLMFYRGE